MTSAAPRILIGRIFHEGHSFNPVATGIAAFDVRYADDPESAWALPGSILGGIITRLRQERARIVPSIFAAAPPGGPADHAVYEAFKHELLDKVREGRVDGVVLELHGAMVTNRLGDPEGDLLQALRSALGPEPVIGVGLDLHAHVTPAMLQAADFCAGCKTNPHADFPETGERVAALVLAAIDGEIAPVTACARLPMILPGGIETDEGPLAALHARAREWIAREPALLDISIFNTQPFIDVELGGQVILAVADRNPGAARAAAADLANAMWRWRHRFRSTLPSIDEALDAVLRSPEARPFVLGDQGDRVLAGAPGDGNAILRRVLERGLDLRMAVPVTDPEAVSVTRSAGVGAEITLSIGGKLTPGFEPLTVTVRVVHLSDGHFVMRGPFLAGQESALGETAVVEIGRVKVMLTSTGGFTQDVAAFTSQGIDPAQQDVIVSKSGHHFKLSFAGIATPLVVGSPGLARYTQGAFPFVRRRPVWPEDAIDLPEVVPALFGRVVTMPAGGTPPLRRLSQAQGSST